MLTVEEYFADGRKLLDQILEVAEVFGLNLELAER